MGDEYEQALEDATQEEIIDLAGITFTPPHINLKLTLI
jgi:hypothetical protein